MGAGVHIADAWLGAAANGTEHLGPADTQSHEFELHLWELGFALQMLGCGRHRCI